MSIQVIRFVGVRLLPPPMPCLSNWIRRSPAGRRRSLGRRVHRDTSDAIKKRFRTEALRPNRWMVAKTRRAGRTETGLDRFLSMAAQPKCTCRGSSLPTPSGATIQISRRRSRRYEEPSEKKSCKTSIEQVSFKCVIRIRLRSAPILARGHHAHKESGTSSVEYLSAATVCLFTPPAPTPAAPAALAGSDSTLRQH